VSQASKKRFHYTAERTESLLHFIGTHSSK